ncbi:bi-domain-containing oxidoreductase [Rosistilla oblonga]|uniref:bi-domain-containing oxidoreductase n=1 Tax=Rosistilla oblonga TaxID=2527990 RepID=UPI003A969E42
MQQVLLAGTGQIEVYDVPIPLRVHKGVLVRNAYSLISSGTESAAVTRQKGVRGLVEKATGSSDRMKQVWDLTKTLGYQQTWELMQNKLQDLTPIGYSSAGYAVEVDSEQLPFRPGDAIACMGAGYANHAEFVAVPRNLVAKVPDGVALQEASFAALACIAMQGIRRLDLSPGERVGVIGLGLIGQICVRLLDALGYQAFGTDLDPARVAKAMEGTDVDAWASTTTDSVAHINARTSGRGLDGVILCAATASSAPVNLAFDLCRTRGRVAVVGDVGMDLSRAKMYRKEIELRLSCSYGTGRYDENYEVNGQDYPLGHVRWTEGRNLEAFLELLARKRMSLQPLISEVFKVQNGQDAYAKLKEPNAKSFGVLLDYDCPSPPTQAVVPQTRTLRVLPASANGTDKVRIGLIGAGGYVKGMHLPNLKKLGEQFELAGVASRSGASAAVVAKRFGARLATSDYRELLGSDEVDAVLVATRHSTHARIAAEALKAGKHVFVEKPMSTTVSDGEEIAKLAEQSGLVVRVGFNRRFSPYMNYMRSSVGEGVRMLSVRANVSTGSGDWSNTESEGGRFLGEAVHFLDLCNWFFGAEPIALAAQTAGDVGATNPNIFTVLRYPCGSSAQLTYTSLGQSRLGKEYFELHGNGRSAVCDDFRTIECFGAKLRKPKLRRGDKGQLDILREFAAAIKGEACEVQGADAQAGLAATRMALAAIESSRSMDKLPVAA